MFVIYDISALSMISMIYIYALQLLTEDSILYFFPYKLSYIAVLTYLHGMIGERGRQHIWS